METSFASNFRKFKNFLIFSKKNAPTESEDSDSGHEAGVGELLDVEPIAAVAAEDTGLRGPRRLEQRCERGRVAGHRLRDNTEDFFIPGGVPPFFLL